MLVVKSLNKGRNTGINWMNRADLGIGDITLVITNWEKDMPFDVDVQFELPKANNLSLLSFAQKLH